MIRAALVVHLSHMDVAPALIDRIRRVSVPADLFVTHAGPLPPAVRAALDRLARPMEVVEVADAGCDIGALFDLLPRLTARGYEVVGKLHSTGAGTPDGQRWQQVAEDGLLASDEVVAGILSQFAQHPDLALLGPRLLYRSAAAHLVRNDEVLSDMARRLLAPAFPPADWGFFAGSSFWARRALLDWLAPLAGTDAPSEPARRDGAHAYAMERLFGLAAHGCGGTIGLVGHGRIQLVPATTPPPRGPGLQALPAPLPANAMAPALAELVTRRNPLLDYIRHGREPGALDPNPGFSSRWYNRTHRDVWDAGFNPLRHYAEHGAAEGRRTAPVSLNPLLHFIRHGRDADALDPNLFFDARWYNRHHADVRAFGFHPLRHYIEFGAAEGRRTVPPGHRNPLLDYIRHGRDAGALDPNPGFSSRFYNTRHRDVFDAGFNPLRHYAGYGRAEGRLAAPPGKPGCDTGDHHREDAGEGHPRRFYPAFDLGRERVFLDRLRRPAILHAQARPALVSVVMPAFNGAARIAAAIRSVLAQTDPQFELLVVDDGSTDGTAAIVAGLAAADPRVRLIAGLHRGVAAARNTALSEAQGEIVAYLDCDNRWKPWFLEVMVAWMAAERLDVGYSAIALRGDGEELLGYRGDEFDWAACLAENYVDLNGLCHRRALVDQLGGFDPGLRRMVDWDLILRYGRGRRVGYAPFVGCEYFDGGPTGGRISRREPTAFQAVIRAKHRPGGSGRRVPAARIRLAFAIKIAAPDAERQNWGDHHFAEGLRAALERLGHTARIDFRGQWYGHSFATEDVVIVLRGLIAYEPKPGRMCFLWVISHPDQVDWTEYDRYSRVYAASESHAALLGTVIAPPVSTMLQATDPARFRPLDEPLPEAPAVLFVGNSRGVDRDVLRWAIQAGHQPDIYGDGWAGRVPASAVRAATIDNASLGGLYAGAGVVLNDHWPAMRAFGLLSNRLFDVVASGGRVVSDPVPSLSAVFGDAVHTVRDAVGLARTVDTLLDTPRDHARERAAAARVHAAHSFDARARVFVRDAFAALGLDTPAGPAPASPDRRLRVHVVAPYGAAGPQSSAFIRLTAPLTDDCVASRIRLGIGSAEEGVPDCDICIVQRTALPDMDAADALLRRVAALGAVLVTDVDDAFALIGADHPEHATYRCRSDALDRVIAASAETWFSTAELARAYRGRTTRGVVVANAVDPRLWRDWRNPRDDAFGEPQLRVLYMGTATHGADFALIRPALERLTAAYGDAFAVTLVGIAPDIAPASWLHRLSPPADAIAYPRFARWLRAQGPFDLGLAPLADTPFNRCKSDIKCLDYAALGMLPLVSDGPAYRADPELARLVLFADEEGGWFQAIAGVLRDRGGAARRAAALQAHVWERRCAAVAGLHLLDRLERLRPSPAVAGPMRVTPPKHLEIAG